MVPAGGEACVTLACRFGVKGRPNCHRNVIELLRKRASITLHDICCAAGL
jgi:hypothetical protein